MNWTSFLLTLTLVYLTYYGLNLLYDLLMSRRPPESETKGDTLFFDEDIQPKIIEYVEETPKTDPDPVLAEPTEVTPTKIAPAGISGTILSTGAVGLKDLFSLAKNNLIEYTGAIPY